VTGKKTKTPLTFRDDGGRCGAKDFHEQALWCW